MAISNLPSTQNNNTNQIRRRYNEVVSQVTNQVGSIASGSGDIGTLHSQVKQLTSQKASLDSPTFTGAVSMPSLPSLTSASVTNSATSGNASSLPSTPSGYMMMQVNGRTVKLPYYGS